MLWLVFPITGAFILKDGLLEVNGGKLLLVMNFTVLFILLIYLGLSYKYKDNYRLYEYAIISTFTVVTVGCTLYNTQAIPESITGTSPDKLIPSSEYLALYFSYSVASILKVQSFLFLITPLYLQAEYFYYKLVV